MAEFKLPANSKVREGKTWPAPEGVKKYEGLSYLSMERR